MSAIIPFLLANWRWLLPLVICAGLAIDDGIHRIALANCHAASAAEHAAAEQAKAEALAHSQAVSDELIIAQAAAMAITERTVTVYRDRIANEPQTSTCGPAVRDAGRGVLDLLTSGAGPPNAGGKPAAAVPGPAAGAKP